MSDLSRDDIARLIDAADRNDPPTTEVPANKSKTLSVIPPSGVRIYAASEIVPGIVKLYDEDDEADEGKSSNKTVVMASAPVPVPTPRSCDLVLPNPMIIPLTPVTPFAPASHPASAAPAVGAPTAANDMTNDDRKRALAVVIGAFVGTLMPAIAWFLLH